MNPDKKFVLTFRRLVKALGRRATFQLVLISYMHANFLYAKPSQKQIKACVAQVLPNFKWTEEVMKDAQSLGAIAEKLDPLFRVQTSEIYFRMMGFAGELTEILDFSAYDVMQSNPSFANVIAAMSDVIEEKN